MKKHFLTYFLTLAAIVFLTSAGQSQNKKHDLVINFGASSGYGYPSGLTSTENSGVPALNASGEYSFSKLFSLGLYGAYTYSFFKFDHPLVGYKDVWKGWDIGIRNTIHLSPLVIKDEKTDLYVALFSGYTTRSLSYDQSNIYHDSLNYKVDAFSVGGILGFRYWINQKFGAYAEAGQSRKFFLGGGISFKINSKNK